MVLTPSDHHIHGFAYQNCQDPEEPPASEPTMEEIIVFFIDTSTVPPPNPPPSPNVTGNERETVAQPSCTDSVPPAAFDPTTPDEKLTTTF
jgi:hypothetical protein